MSGTEVDLYGALSLTFEGLRDDLRADRERERAERVPPQPIEDTRRNSQPFPSSGVLGLNMGGPQQGRVWRVRSIAVGGATPTTTEAGRADIFTAATPVQVLADPPASGSQPGANGFIFATGFARGCMNNWRDQTTTLPNVAFYGHGDLTVAAGEQLWVVFSSGTSTDVLFANVHIDDYEQAAYALSRRA